MYQYADELLFIR